MITVEHRVNELEAMLSQKHQSNNATDKQLNKEISDYKYMLDKSLKDIDIVRAEKEQLKD